MTSISETQVDLIANFAQLEFPTEEKKEIAQHLANMLTFAQQLAEVNTDDVEPTVTVLELNNVWREDKVVTWLDRTEALSQAKQVQDGCFKVPRIMDVE